ncbi:MAG: protein arginine kinase, partial [Candidatus Scalindua sp.]|nr:protein arginine kinase [Candidatus Scalindua sp.]
MEIKDLSDNTGEWLRGTGKESDIVISSRIRLARNIAGYPFLSRANLKQRTEIESLLRNTIIERKIAQDVSYVNLNQATAIDKLFLVERHLISKEHAEGEGERGVAFGKSETVSLMINEEDHLRIQVIRSGFEIKKTWDTIDEIDNLLGESLNFAFSSKFGFLTACPTNVGTGMRVSVMLHLPALGMTKHIEKVFNAVGKLGLVVRGLYGEGTKVSGDLYQISNQFALGKSEKEILSIIESVIPRITSYERMARKALVMESKDQLEDRIWRSYGMLKAARMITSEEILQLLSQVRMGVNI